MHDALEGVTVLDFTQVIAGPYCSLMLADLGAEVIKVEHPERGDLMRLTDPRVSADASYPFLMINRNKQSVAIDFTKPRAIELIRSLAEKVDVLLAGFRPGTLERYDLGYEQLRERNPGLIYASISGFGTWGPYAKRGAYDLIVQAMCGIMRVTGKDGETKPARMGFPFIDVSSASFMVSSILAALLSRARSGEGQHVEVSLLEAAQAGSIWHAARWFHAQEVSSQYGPGLPFLMFPYRIFEAADGHLVVSIGGGKQWPRACEILGLDDELRDDPALGNARGRYENRERVLPPIEAAMKGREVAELVEAFAAAGIPAGAVNTVAESLQDPHVAERGFVDFEHPEVGSVRTLATPLRSSKTRTEVRRLPPRLGQHTREVLAGLGVDAAEIDSLAAGGIIRVDDAGGDG